MIVFLAKDKKTTNLRITVILYLYSKVKTLGQADFMSVLPYLANTPTN